MYELCRNVKAMGLRFDSEANTKRAEDILKQGNRAPSKITDGYIDNVKALWLDRGIRRCFLRSNEFQLIDNAE
jgi:hypothetical protein